MSALTTAILAALMLAVAAHHLGRLAFSVVRRRPAEPAVDLTHAAMGGVMALMLLAPVPADWGRPVAAAFVVPLAWFAWRTARRHAHAWCHTVLAAGMVVMLLVPQPAAAAPGTSSMASMGHVHHGAALPGDPVIATAVGSGGPHATLVLLAGSLSVALLIVAAWTAAGLVRGPGRGSVAVLGPPAPLLTAGCQLLMAAVTAGMLVVMV